MDQNIESAHKLTDQLIYGKNESSAVRRGGLFQRMIQDHVTHLEKYYVLMEAIELPLLVASLSGGRVPGRKSRF